MSGKRNEPWKNAERHYCAVCGVWMGSDRQSILIHENGKKHRENLEKSLRQKRDDKLKEEKEANDVQKALKMMEQAAGQKILHDVATGSFQISESYGTSSAGFASMNSFQASVPVSQQGSKEEMKSWQDRKEKRKQKDMEGSNDVDKQNEKLEQQNKRRKFVTELDPSEGFYKHGDKTYLDGRIYSLIMEEDMPVEIWIGAESMNYEYRRTEQAKTMWKPGIIIKAHKVDDQYAASGIRVNCDISYLRDVNDDDETIEKKVPGERLRLLLGSDDLIPSTLEEARLSLMGGEEIVEVNNGNSAEIDENTGLSSWGTVSVKRVTVSQEVKDERARARAKRREAIEKEKMKEREELERKLEEAKHSTGDDSALGAYDVFATSSKKGYKGLNIHSETKVEVADMAKSLSKGKTNVKFKSVSGKKSMFKAAKKKQNRRKTFADDDD